MASEEPKTPEKEDSSLEFSTPLTSKKSINSSVIQLAFKKKNTTGADVPKEAPKSSMVTETIDVNNEGESGNNAQSIYTAASSEHAAQTSDTWDMHWTDEGYLYYYNSLTGESRWAELDDPNYGFAQKSAHVDEEDDEDEDEDDDDDSEEYTEDDEDYDEDSDDDDATDDDDDDSELDEDYDTDDAELGLQGRSKGKSGLERGGVMLDTEMEASFRDYLGSEEGKRAFEEEQMAIERRLEKRFKAQQAKRDRRKIKSYRGKGKDGKSGKGKGAHGSRGATDGGLGPLEAVGGALSGIFSGVATITGNVTNRAGTVIEDYWKNKYHSGRGNDNEKDEGGGKDRRRRTKREGDGPVGAGSGSGARAGARSRKMMPASDNSADLLEAAMNGDHEEGRVTGQDDDEDASDDDGYLSVSSDDSDVQELASPLLPDWLRPERLKRLMGRRAVKFTHDLATTTLSSAEWLLEMTGRGVTVVGTAVWNRLNVVLKQVVEDHYTIEGGNSGGNTIPTPISADSATSAHAAVAPVTGSGGVMAPSGATTQAYFISPQPKAPKGNVPPGKPPVPEGATPSLADSKGETKAGLEAA